MPQFHATAPRGEQLAPQSQFIEGRFGRMFRTLPAFTPPVSDLTALGGTMFEPASPGPDGPIPAGYTYLGQFIDHDITFDPVSSLQRLNDPDALHDFRTPRLDLDSLYGSGPNNDPFMYDPAVDGGKTRFLIGKNANGELDLPRNVLPPVSGVPQGRALIGDPRNDENTIVSQLQLLFLRFHNHVVKHVRDANPNLTPDQLFTRAQRLVQWHYQWIVAHDFLHRTVGDTVVHDILKRGQPKVPGGKRPAEVDLKFFKWQQQPFMPVEFSVAAYRFGHSMIRDDYQLNTNITDVEIFTPGALTDEHQDLRGFRPLASAWEIEWKFFFETGGTPQHARKIDTKLSRPLAEVAGTDAPHSLPVRNLRRGRALRLPSGQSVATAMGLTPLSDAELGLPASFAGHAPLWFYVLKEAETQAGGAHLGPVGGRIVAEVLLGLLKGDPFSFVNVEPAWEPTLGAKPGTFKMQDLIEFVG